MSVCVVLPTSEWLVHTQCTLHMGVVGKGHGNAG